jgi:hypothetical protein
VRVPGLREVVSWNLVVVLRKHPAAIGGSPADGDPTQAIEHMAPSEQRR